MKRKHQGNGVYKYGSNCDDVYFYCDDVHVYVYVCVYVYIYVNMGDVDVYLPYLVHHTCKCNLKSSTVVYRQFLPGLARKSHFSPNSVSTLRGSS